MLINLLSKWERLQLARAIMCVVRVLVWFARHLGEVAYRLHR